MVERVAKSLIHLRDQINALAPSRDKSSDGTFGDPAHRARKSDHNPDENGVVCALDITNDPLHGVDSEKLAEHLRSKKDPRLQFVISNKKIANMDIEGGVWRKYTGDNPHNHHCHISVRHNLKLADATKDWDLPEIRRDLSAPNVVPVETVKKGMDNVVVNELKLNLNKILLQEKGFGDLTEALVKAYQRKKGLSPDGVVGVYTTRAIKGDLG